MPIVLIVPIVPIVLIVLIVLIVPIVPIVLISASINPSQQIFREHGLLHPG